MHQSANHEIEKQIRQSPEQWLSRKLYAVAFREKGMTYPELSKWFGESQRTIARWVRAFKMHGLAGLEEKEPGRPTRLTPEQRAEVTDVIRNGPARVGCTGTAWTGHALADWINKRWGVRLTASCPHVLREGQPGLAAVRLERGVILRR